MGLDSSLIAKAIDTWYSANYPSGVRLTAQQRTTLAEHVERGVRAAHDDLIRKAIPKMEANVLELLAPAVAQLDELLADGGHVGAATRIIGATLGTYRFAPS